MARADQLDSSGHEDMTALEKELRVSLIPNGYVIDHLPADYGIMKILTLLGIDTLLKKGARAFVAANVESTSMGMKHIIKVESMPTVNLHVLGLLNSPRKITVSFIEEYKVVYKEQLSRPDYFEGVLRCSSPACISNSDIVGKCSPEPIRSRFSFSTDWNAYKCLWCGTAQDDNILDRVRPEITSDIPSWFQSPSISPYNVSRMENSLDSLYQLMKGNFLAYPFNFGNQKVAFWKTRRDSRTVYLTPFENCPDHVKQRIIDADVYR